MAAAYFSRLLGGATAVQSSAVPGPAAVPCGEITLEELARFDARDPALPIYLSIKGRVFDVSPGHEYYGLGGPYHLFAGLDASLAFAKTDKDPAFLTGDLSRCTPAELATLAEWEEKFEAKYCNVGRLVPNPFAGTYPAVFPRPRTLAEKRADLELKLAERREREAQEEAMLAGEAVGELRGGATGAAGSSGNAGAPPARPGSATRGRAGSRRPSLGDRYGPPQPINPDKF